MNRSLAITALLLALPTRALAYNLETDTTGAAQRWAQDAVTFHLDPHSRDLSPDQVLGAAQRAASHWAAAAPVAVTVELAEGHGAPGYDSAHPAQNRSEIFFVEDEWELNE